MSIISMQSQVKKINSYRRNAQNYFFFGKQMAAILYFVIFHIIYVFVNIAPILIDVHYFDAESSEKK